MASEIVAKGQGFTVSQDSDGSVVVKIDPNAPRVPSKSGKTQVVASSRGNMQIDVEGQAYWLGLNFYTK